MNYEEFVTEVKEKVEEIFDGTLQIDVITTLKNNGQERVGLAMINTDVNISPTIYLEEYYEQYLNEYSIQWIVQNIAELYEEVKVEKDWKVTLIQDFDAVKPRIAYKLINARRNKKLLATLPHRRYLDLALVFYVLIDVDSAGTATIPINYDLLKMWGTNLEEIYEIAHKNMPELLPSSFKPMYIAMSDLLKGTPYNYTGEPSPLYVLTNSICTFGASCILYDDILAEIGEEVGENFYVLPSSIHETIIVPESISPNRADLKEMIREINKTQVSKEEMLANNAYFYDRKLKYLY